MKRNLTPIASGVALFLMGAAMSAQAQQADEPVQTVVTTGIRASLQQSLNVKKNAQQHIDVISAEDIGKMPDKNVADSLARVPGVTILNSPSGGSGGFDERDRVGLRGTNPSLTQTLLDGHSVANGDWFVLDQTGAGVGRSVSFSLLPSELVSRVEVHKSASASDIEGGTAGNVNIITRKPLEFSKSLTIEASVGAVYADLPKKTDPQMSAMLGWKNDAKTFGILVQVFDEKRHLRRDGVETIALDAQPHAYQAIDPTKETAVTTQVPALAGVLYPNLMGSALFTQERTRKGGLITEQVKPTDDVTVTLTGFSSKMDANNYNRNYMLAMPWALQDPGVTLNSYTVDPATNVMTAANFSYATPTKIGVQDLISREASAETNFISLDTSWKVNDALKLKFNWGMSKGKGTTDSQDVFEGDIFATSGGFQQHGSGSAPSFNIGNSNAAAITPANTDWIFGDQNVVVADKDAWASLDADYMLDAGVLRSLDFGVRSSTHRRNTEGAIIGQGPNWAQDWQHRMPVFSETYPSNFGSGLGSDFPTGVAYVSADDLKAWDAVYAVRPLSRREPTHEYSVTEKNSAGYVQGNLEGTGWSGNVGVRFVHTKETTLVWAPTSDTSLPGYAPSAFAAVGPNWTDPSGYYQTFVDRSYSDVLPSASIRIDVAPKVVGRVGLSRTMTRPDYTALSSAQLLGTYTDPTGTTVGSGTTGNADLNPIRSNNFDANLEWYFAPRSLVSVGAFRMQMGSYIIDGVKRVTATTDLVPPGGQPGATTNPLITAPFDLTTQINKKATVNGLEFAFETPIWGNYGVSANYTYAKAKDEDNHALRGAVKNSLNVSGFYENDQFSARLTYGYNSDNFLGRDRGTDYYQRGVGVLSATLGYKINDHFALSLDAQNLNDPILKYYGDLKSEPRAVYKNGRQYYLSARYKY